MCLFRILPWLRMPGNSRWVRLPAANVLSNGMKSSVSSENWDPPAGFWASQSALTRNDSPDRNNVVIHNGTAQLGRPTLARLFAHQILTQRRLRRHHRYLLPLVFDFQAAILGPDEIEGARASRSNSSRAARSMGSSAAKSLAVSAS